MDGEAKRRGYRERVRESRLLEYSSVAGFAARQRPHPGEVATVQLMRADR